MGLACRGRCGHPGAGLAEGSWAATTGETGVPITLLCCWLTPRSPGCCGKCKEIAWDFHPGEPQGSPNPLGEQSGSPCFCRRLWALLRWGSPLPPARPSGGAGLQSRGAPGALSRGTARVRIWPPPTARPAPALRFGVVEARKGGREGEVRGCPRRGLRQAPSRCLQRGCAGPRASQHRAIRANLIKTDSPIGGLPPINSALALH